MRKMNLTPVDQKILSLLDDIIEKYPTIFNAKDGVYELTDGRCVPRVTKMLHYCIHNDGLMKWANYIGFKRQNYTQVLDQAALVGTHCHEYINNFLVKSEEPKRYDIIDIPIESYNAYLSFITWYKNIQTLATIRTIKNEYPLLCKYFGGTLDGLYELNGKLYIVDYKTSNHITSNYCLQIAAYDFMLEFLEDIHTDGYIILQLSKNSPNFNEFSLHKYNSQHVEFMNYCRTAFLSMSLWYYYMNIIQNKYKSLELVSKK